MKIIEKSKKMNRSVVFKDDVEDDNKQVEHDIDKSLSESIAFIAKGFRKFMRILDKSSIINVTTTVKDNMPLSDKGLDP